MHNFQPKNDHIMKKVYKYNLIISVLDLEMCLEKNHILFQNVKKQTNKTLFPSLNVIIHNVRCGGKVYNFRNKLWNICTDNVSRLFK